MGLTAERVAQHYGITREEADAFALASHQKALAAIEAGRFDAEIVPVTVTYSTNGAGKSSSQPNRSAPMKVRAQILRSKRWRTQPAFHARGTVTAGNSSQTSDGAAAAVVMSQERAAALGIKPLARFVSFATAGCLPEEMGVGPVYAVQSAETGRANPRPNRPHRAERSLCRAIAGSDPATASDPAKVNVSGGAIALAIRSVAPAPS